MNKKVLKIGLDLDGVILYNPARIFRPIISTAKRLVLRKNKDKVNFYIPKTKLEKIIWFWIHKSSIFPASGFKDFLKASKNKEIELYIITARFSFLKEDFEHWLHKIGAPAHVAGWFYNKHDEQPHLYKEKKIKELKLDYFVDDNWDIVRKLNASGVKTTVIWIYNLFDKRIDYAHKVPSLKEAYKKIQKERK